MLHVSRAGMRKRNGTRKHWREIESRDVKTRNHGPRISEVEMKMKHRLRIKILGTLAMYEKKHDWRVATLSLKINRRAAC
jgi:hypothetical protein